MPIFHFSTLYPLRIYLISVPLFHKEEKKPENAENLYDNSRLKARVLVFGKLESDTFGD